MVLTVGFFTIKRNFYLDMKYILFAFILIIFASCSKEEKQTTKQEKTPQNQVEEIDDNPSDTEMTPGKRFSTSIMLDFLDSDDEFLGEYIESEIYKMGANYTGASVVELNLSTWLVVLEKEGAVKNYLLQKFVDFKTNDYYFRMKETALTITDVITNGKAKTINISGE
jgi:hypothetical protein